MREVSQRTKRLANYANVGTVRKKANAAAAAEFSSKFDEHRSMMGRAGASAGDVQMSANQRRTSSVLGFSMSRRRSSGGGGLRGSVPCGAARRRHRAAAAAATAREAGLARARPSRKDRNRRLGIAFGLLVADALLSIIFTTLASTRGRTRCSPRRLNRTIWVQGIASIADAVVSFAVVVHVVQGILGASLDNFMEAAATKILQAIFFSLLQTGYPTALRLAWIAVLLLCRVLAAALIFSAAFYSGVLTARLRASCRASSSPCWRWARPCRPASRNGCARRSSTRSSGR